jgi:peptide/nickel transport system ATP-binding protein
VVILDEPTTGLDVTTKAKITTMLQQMVDELAVAAIYVSHDWPSSEASLTSWR